MAIAITAGLVTTATAQNQVKNTTQQQAKKNQPTKVKQSVNNTANKQTRSDNSEDEKKLMEEKVRKHQAEIEAYEKKVEKRKKDNLEYELNKEEVVND